MPRTRLRPIHCPWQHDARWTAFTHHPAQLGPQTAICPAQIPAPGREPMQASLPRSGVNSDRKCLRSIPPMVGGVASIGCCCAILMRIPPSRRTWPSRYNTSRSTCRAAGTDPSPPRLPGLLQDADNMLFRKLLPLHLSIPSSGLDSNSNWRKKRGVTSTHIGNQPPITLMNSGHASSPPP